MESNKKTYEVKQGEKVYTLTTSLLDDLIKMDCKSSNAPSYTRIFSIDEFRSLDKEFNSFYSAYEVLEYLDKNLGKTVRVKEENGGIKIILFSTSNGLIHQIEIPLGDNISDTNFTYETFNEQYPTSSFLTQNQNYNHLQNVEEQYSTPIYSNNANDYITTDNIEYNLGESNNNNYLTNQYFESSLGYGNNNLPSKILRRTYYGNSGLEQDVSQDVRNSLPLPSFDSNQFLNNYNSSNEYIQNYDTTSVEIPIEPHPTLPITTYPEINTNEEFNNQFTSNSKFGAEYVNTNQFNNEYTTDNIFIEGDITKDQLTSENNNQFFIEDVSNQFNNKDINTIIEEPITNQYLTEDFNQYVTEEPGLANNYNSDYQNKKLSRSLIVPSIQNDLNGYFNQTYKRTITTNRHFAEPHSLTLLNNTKPNLSPRISLSLEKSKDETDGTLSTVEKIPNPSNVFHSHQQPQIDGVNISQNRTSIEQKMYTSLPIKTIEQKKEDPKNIRFNLTLFQSKNEDDRINKLEGNTNSLKNDYQQLENKLNSLSNELNSYNSQIGSLGRESKQREIDDLREENMAIKQQLVDLNNLRYKAAELNSLKEQLAELDPLRKKAEEMEILKNQLRGFNDLKSRLAELHKLKSQLDEIDQLRARVSHMNNTQDKLSELNLLRVKTDDAESLKQKIQEMENERIKYESEIQNLRNFADSLKSEQQQSSYKETISKRTQNIVVQGDIIENMYELEMITGKINKFSPKITLNLLYKATVDSDKASAFHERCDQAESSLVLIKTDKGKRFGGFTTCSWIGDCIDKFDEEAFIFSLDKMMIYENIPGEEAIGCYPNFGPTFLGCQIKIYDDAFTRGGTTFLSGLNYDTEEDFELTGGDRFFGVKEIEVYEVIFH